jgi:hypothetical protein
MIETIVLWPPLVEGPDDRWHTVEGATSKMVAEGKPYWDVIAACGRRFAGRRFRTTGPADDSLTRCRECVDLPPFWAD